MALMSVPPHKFGCPPRCNWIKLKNNGVVLSSNGIFTQGSELVNWFKTEMVTHRQLRWFRQPNFDIFTKDALIKNRHPYVQVTWRCAQAQEHHSIYCHTKEMQNYLHVSPSYYSDSSHIFRKHRQKIDNTCTYVVFDTQEPLQSHNIPPLWYNNFNTHIAQCPHRWPQYIIRFTLYVVSVGRPHGPFRSDADQPQRI